MLRLSREPELWGSQDNHCNWGNVGKLWVSRCFVCGVLVFLVAGYMVMEVMCYIVLRVRRLIVEFCTIVGGRT